MALITTTPGDIQQHLLNKQQTIAHMEKTGTRQSTMVISTRETECLAEQKNLKVLHRKLTSKLCSWSVSKNESNMILYKWISFLVVKFTSHSCSVYETHLFLICSLIATTLFAVLKDLTQFTKIPHFNNHKWLKASYWASESMTTQEEQTIAIKNLLLTASHSLRSSPRGRRTASFKLPLPKVESMYFLSCKPYACKNTTRN